MFRAQVIADSIYTTRLTTMEVVFPRIILAEFNTHRVFSRNSASSRAIPVQKMIDMVVNNPYVPRSWGSNQKGMQAGEPLGVCAASSCERAWLKARDYAVSRAQELLDLGVHKQLTNRLLEPFMWHTVIVSSTEWSNFFNLRDNPAAHPDMQTIAGMMKRALAESTPKEAFLNTHLPYITQDDIDQFSVSDLMKISVGRCARVSYLTHDGKRAPAEDIRLHDQLLAAGHMSPFEHVAFRQPAQYSDAACGNFRGWMQYRKTIAHESDILGKKGAV